MHNHAVTALTAVVAIAGAAHADVVDAQGDAVASDHRAGPLLDIDTVHVGHTDTDLFFEITFHSPISAPSDYQPDSLFGSLEFDLDQDAATGWTPGQNGHDPFLSLDAGFEKRIEFGHEYETPGFVTLFDTKTFDQTPVAVEYTDHSVSGWIALDVLGDDGDLDYTAIIGTGPQATDATDYVGTSVPTPGALALLGIGALTTTRRRR